MKMIVHDTLNLGISTMKQDLLNVSNLHMIGERIVTVPQCREAGCKK